MKWRWCIALLLLVPSIAAEAQEYFPMEKGTAWVYRGTVAWTLDNSSQVRRKKITWRVTVIDHAVQGDSEAALFRGWPSDLAWYEDGEGPNLYALVRKGASYYFLPNDAAEVLTSFRNTKAYEPSAEAIFFTRPLRKGRKHCDPSEPKRSDTFYCWHVPERSKVSLHVTGIEGDEHDAFVLQYYTMPEHERMEFVPGIGITKYEFHHHGTVSDVDLRLVSYSPATK